MTAATTLGSPQRPAEPRGVHEYRGRAARPAAADSGPIRVHCETTVRPVSHAWACPLRTHGGACTCDPDLRTTSRGFTYDLAGMLGEGWYEDQVNA